MAPLEWYNEDDVIAIKSSKGHNFPYVEEMGSLPGNWSAQTCELYALNQALKLLQTHDMHMEWYTLL